jgi:elongation factor 2
LDIKGDKDVLVNDLFEKFNWDKSDASRIWAFGPEMSGPNVLVDQRSGIQATEEHVQDWFNSAFQWATKEGVMCDEELRGVRINIVDFVKAGRPHS